MNFESNKRWHNHQMSFFPHHQRSFLLWQIRTHTEIYPLQPGMTDLGTFSPKLDVFIESLPSGVKESQRRGSRMEELGRRGQRTPIKHGPLMKMIKAHMDTETGASLTEPTWDLYQFYWKWVVSDFRAFSWALFFLFFFFFSCPISMR